MKFKNLNNFITKIPANYLADMAKKNVAFVGNCKDLYTYFQKINKNCKYFSITKQNWKSVVKSLTQKDKNNMPKFDVIVGNPPYEGQGNPLYLKIAEICVKNCEKVIWLCPTQWTNTLKNVKWYDYYKENLNCEFFLSVGNPFDNAALANEVGIYVFGENKIDLNELVYNKFKNANLVKSIWEKNLNFIKTNKSIWDFNQIDYKKKYYVHNTGIRGNVKDSKPLWDWTTLFGSTAHTDFSKETVVFDSRQIMWNFNTKSECENFISCYETDIMMFMLYCVKMNNNNHRGECAYIPWFGDYTKQWTETEIANKLKLTKEEVKYIHQEMANFGWKAAPRMPKPETKDKMNVSMKAQTKVQKLEVITKEQIKKLQIKGLNLVTQIKKKNVAEFGRAYGVEWRKINKKFSDNQTLRSYNYAKARIAVAKKFV